MGGHDENYHQPEPFWAAKEELFAKALYISMGSPLGPIIWII